MSLRKTLYMLSGTLRGLFFILSLVIIIGVIIHIQRLVNDLREESRTIVEFYAQTVQRIASETETPDGLGWFFENVISRTNFPLVLTDLEGKPTSWKGISVPENDRSPEAIRQVRKIMGQMKMENEPVPITYNDQPISYLYYGDSNLIAQLIYLPYITFSGLGLLILVAFLGFNSIKKSELRFIWVGMAKETAHQLGTPISSLLGWLEILKSDSKMNKQRKQIGSEIQADVDRLQKVAERFSQIGSEAHLDKVDIHEILNDVIIYFRRRVPQTGKKITIAERFSKVPPLPLNKELFEWAVENLIKNAIDAVKGKDGMIEVITGIAPDHRYTYIDIRDNGTGIHVKRRRDIFKAGYSTKKRGWGLGLNFAKRIIEDYHHGKLFIKETHPGKGTTMRILI